MDRLPQIIRSIPRHCFEKDDNKARAFLVRDLALLFIIGTLILLAGSAFLKLLLSIVSGCVLTGIFVIGHDAGHRSFSDNKSVNDLVGHLCCSLTLWPYHVWRLSHDHHHKWTHHAENDVAWKPLTADEFRKLSQGKKIGYFLSRSVFFFWASMLFQYFMVDDAIKGRFFSPNDRDMIRRSLIITAAVAVAYAGLTLKVGGWSGFLYLFLIPQLVYQFWLSFFTLFHHTTPDSRFMSEESWDPARAQLAHSIHMKYPPIVDWLTHDIAWHVPHHVCVSIPHYRLREAHVSLRTNYPDIVTENRMSLGYIWRVISRCHLIDQSKADPVEWVGINIRDHIIESDPDAAGDPA
jgi:omega-6 fatty acid desaturase (delta-12 desaturase)